MRRESKDMPETSKAEEQTKKAYATPRLTFYGTVEKITQGLATGHADAAMAGSPAL